MSAVAQKQWTSTEVEELTLELLGNLLHKDPTALRGELLAKGAASQLIRSTCSTS